MEGFTSMIGSQLSCAVWWSKCDLDAYSIILDTYVYGLGRSFLRHRLRLSNWIMSRDMRPKSFIPGSAFLGLLQGYRLSKAAAL